LTAWASAGEGKRGGLAPPPLTGQNSMFFDFFERIYFLGIFKANRIFLPSLEKKSADTNDDLHPKI